MVIDANLLIGLQFGVAAGLVIGMLFGVLFGLYIGYKWSWESYKKEGLKVLKKEYDFTPKKK